MAGTSANIEVLFKAVGHQQVQAAFASVSASAKKLVVQPATSAIDAGLKSSASAATTLVSNVFGVVPALHLAQGAVHLVEGAFRTAALSAAGLGAAVYATIHAFAPINDANQNLMGTVLALRAMNGEIDSARGKPSFVPDAKGNGLFDAAGGHASKTANDLSYLNQLADKNGNSIRDLSQDYLRLKAATDEGGISLASMRRMFTGISDAGLVLALTPDKLAHAMLAVQEIADKGQLSAVQLRRQLAIAIPGSYEMTANAFGVTGAQLAKMMEKGQISSAEFFDKFGKAIKDKYANAAKSMTDTTRVAIGRLKNEWFSAEVLIGNGRLDKSFANIINAASKLVRTLIDNGAFSRFGAKLGDTLDRVAKLMGDTAANADRFENGLNMIAGAFDFMVRAGLGVFHFLESLGPAFHRVEDILSGFGLKIPSVEEVLTGLGDTINATLTSFQTGNFSENPFANFLASILSVATELGRALFSAAGNVVHINSIGDAFQYAAYWMGQLAHAIRAVSTNGADTKGLDSLGVTMAINVKYALGYVRELFTILADVVQFVIVNKDAFAAFFVGAIDTIHGVTDAIAQVSTILKDLGLSKSAGYYLGVAYIVDKLMGLTVAKLAVQGIKAAFSGVSSLVSNIVPAFTAIASAISISSLALLGWVAAIVAIGAAVYLMWKYWDEIKTVLKVDFLYVVAGIDLLLAKMIALVPGMGGVAKDMRDAAEAYSNAANNEKTLLTIRERMRAQPYYKDLIASGLSDGDALKKMQSIMDAHGRFPTSQASDAQTSAPAAPAFPDFGTMLRQKVGAIPDTNGFIQSQSAAAQAGIANDNTLAGAGANVGQAGQPGANADFTRPITIYLSDGTQVDALGRASDGQTFEDLAAKTAKNRAGQSAAWAG